MAKHNVKATLLIRNDSAQAWASNNPKLEKGELGVEIDTGLLKVGDGTHLYNELDYINSHVSVDGALITTNNDGQLTVANYGKEYWYYDNELDTVRQQTVSSAADWPTNVELEVKNGTARWVVPKANYDRINGTISGIFVTLANNPTNNMDAATKIYVDNAITQRVPQEIANADVLKRSIVTTLPSNNDALPNTIYMIRDTSITGGDQYKEYLLIDNVLTQIGDTSIDLSDYIQKISSATDGHLVSVANDGSLIDAGVSASDLTLRVATTSRLGGVLSTPGPNGVTVDSLNGYMYINDVSTTKLYVPTGDEFILNGGTSSGG